MGREAHSKLVKWISDPTMCILKIISSAQAATINILIKKLKTYIQRRYIFTTTDIEKRKRALNM